MGLKVVQGCCALNNMTMCLTGVAVMYCVWHRKTCSSGLSFVSTSKLHLVGIMRAVKQVHWSGRAAVCKAERFCTELWAVSHSNTACIFPLYTLSCSEAASIARASWHTENAGRHTHTHTTLLLIKGCQLMSRFAKPIPPTPVLVLWSFCAPIAAILGFVQHSGAQQLWFVGQVECFFQDVSLSGLPE